MALAVAIVTEVVGSLSLKAALLQPWSYAVTALGYLAAFGALSLTLRWGMSLGVAYGIWSATGVALTAIGGVILFDEPFTYPIAGGIVLIMLGVLLVELGSGRPASQERGDAA